MNIQCTLFWSESWNNWAIKLCVSVWKEKQNKTNDTKNLKDYWVLT